MSDARERAQEWLAKYPEAAKQVYGKIIRDLIASLTEAEREIVECKSAERMLMDALEKADKERDEAIAENEELHKQIESLEEDIIQRDAGENY